METSPRKYSLESLENRKVIIETYSLVLKTFSISVSERLLGHFQCVFITKYNEAYGTACKLILAPTRILCKDTVTKT